MPIDLLLAKALELLTGSQLVKDKLQRTEVVIRVLKQLGLDPEHPPADFEGVYNYALVEYGVGKPKPCLELFRASEIRQVFRTAFDQNNAQLWLASAEQFLESSAIGDAVTALGFDPQRELATFASCFIVVAKRTRTPGDVLMSHQVTSVQQQLAQVMAQLEQMPTLEGMRTELTRLAGAETLLLPGASPQSCRAFALAQQMREWFETLGYRFESHEVWDTDYFEWIIDIPVRRGRYDRILVRGVDGEVGIKDVRSLFESVTAQKADEGWVVTARRISQAARGELATAECEGLAAFTLDELLDQDADFGGYLDWLESEIAQRGIEARYVPIACTKEEVDPLTHQRLGISRYGEGDGWTEGYMNLWLDDPAKEHLSILGEFGTGKTWLALHYAAGALRAYREAKAKGMARPRLPIVIPLRDYAKAVSVESLFSEFFFRKHEIPIPGYSAFEQLNRMGKLLLIFDGFDEMAARVDKQQMINNFWELAKVVVPGSKVILTCRTEHFPEAREGRALLNAELQASTKGLSGETPQFEVLELEKFEDEQIRQVLTLSASEATVTQVMGNPQLLDLARRPVMTELILEALPEIEAGKPVDISRVYLYAVRRKMERDIKADRTFTSMADKLYFLCELSWEMLSNDKMSINYREFPDRIRKLFGAAVQEEKDLDHWHYDMMGQTMLIRNADGDYTPAHRSLLEFFVAFKFAAELGALAPDFLELAQMKSGIDRSLEPRDYTWSEYFGGGAVAPLKGFLTESLEVLRSGFGYMPLSQATIELLASSLQHTSILYFLRIIRATSKQVKENVLYIGGNSATMALKLDQFALSGENLEDTILCGADLTNANLYNLNLTNSNLEKSIFKQVSGRVLSIACGDIEKSFFTGESSGIIRGWNLENMQNTYDLRGHTDWVRALSLSEDNSIIASGSDDRTIRIWDTKTFKCLMTLRGHLRRLYSVSISRDCKILVSGSRDKTIRIWDLNTGSCIRVLDGHLDEVNKVLISSDDKTIISCSSDKTIKIWDFNSGKCINTLRGHSDEVKSISLNQDSTKIVSAGSDGSIRLWNFHAGNCEKFVKGHDQDIHSVIFNEDGQKIISCSSDKKIKIWDSQSLQYLGILGEHSDEILATDIFLKHKILLSASNDSIIKIWDLDKGICLNTLNGYASMIYSVNLSSDNQNIVASGEDGKVRVWDIGTSKCIRTFKSQNCRVWCAMFSNDKNFIASCGSDSTIELFDLTSSTCIKTTIGSKKRSSVYDIAFGPDNNFIVSCGADKIIRFWHVNSGICFRELIGHEGRVFSVSMSPDYTFIASSSEDRTIRIWDVNTGSCMKLLQSNTVALNTLAISSDGKYIFSSNEENILAMWCVETGTCIKTFEGHTDRIVSIACTANGTLASCSYDKQIRIWNCDTGGCTRILSGHSSSVWSIAISSDSKILVSGSLDETVRVWEIETGKCIDILSNRPYEGMNITGVKGLSSGTIASLKALGAVEDADTED